MSLVKPDLRAANRVFNVLAKAKLPLGVLTTLYVNGREHGYHVSTSTRAASFSENRNSDQIVVYFGQPRDFDCANRPDDYAYASRAYYAHNQAKEAARDIAAYLNGVRK